jgi:hypothetical protein
MSEAPAFDRMFVVEEQRASVRRHAYPTAPIIRSARQGERMPAESVIGRAYKGQPGWARVKLPSGVIGYIWSGYGQWEESP